MYMDETIVESNAVEIAPSAQSFLNDFARTGKQSRERIRRTHPSSDEELFCCEGPIAKLSVV